MIRIIAIGKKHESWVCEGLERYQKRLRQPFTIEWVLLPHSKREGLQAREEESEALLARLRPHEVVILLEERGDMLSSPDLATTLQSYLQTGSVTLVIGGAYGVNQRMRERATRRWSLSKLVFPHMLVRLLVVEQLYRAQEISAGGPYHHE
jgi:23S rRNA (pseudouridine1915-N3)-methyltransferase